MFLLLVFVDVLSEPASAAQFNRSSEHLSEYAKSSIRRWIKLLTRMPCQLTEETTMCEEIVELADWPACDPKFSMPSGDEKCVVYSFGIANNWDFEAQAGANGCTVHAFDPTVKYVKTLAQNVEFRCVGLGGDKVKGKHLQEFSHQHYGSVVGPIENLHFIQSKILSHDKDQIINILKIDCEGCEWPALDYVARHHPSLLDNVLQINVELHFTKSLQVDSILHLEMVGNVLAFLTKAGFRLWYTFPQGGSKFDREHMPELLDLGFPRELCCFEVGFTRHGVKKLRRPALRPARFRLPRPASYLKVGQLCSNQGTQFITHAQLSQKGLGYTTPERVKETLLPTIV